MSAEVHEKIKKTINSGTSACYSNFQYKLYVAHKHMYTKVRDAELEFLFPVTKLYSGYLNSEEIVLRVS